MKHYIGKDGRKKLFKHDQREYNGRYFYLCPETGYYKSRYPVSTLLHKAIWEDNFGPVPDGYIVHHKDHDKINNDPMNFELMTLSMHAKHHAPHNKWVGSPENKKQLIEAGKMSKEWHASPEGIEWHSTHGRATWVNRQKYTKECIICGNEYQTPFPTRSKYCHANCKQQATRDRNK